MPFWNRNVEKIEKFHRKVKKCNFERFAFSSCKPLGKQLSFDYRFLRRIYERKLKVKKLCPDAPTKKKDTWIIENFYAIEAEYELIKKSINSLPCLPSECGVPRIFGAVSNALSSHNFIFDDEGVRQIYKGCEECSYITVAEFFSSGILFRAGIISHIAYLVANGAGSEALGAAISSLHYISHHRFDRDIYYSSLIPILNRDPDGAFPHMTDESKAMYLEKLARGAKKRGISEIKYAKELLLSAQNAKDAKHRHIGYNLFIKSNAKKCIYFSSILLLVVFFALLFLYISPLCLFALFPIFEASKTLVDFIFSHATRAEPIPRMNIKNVPSSSPVLVVITSLISGERADGELFDRLERLYLSNGGNNIYFGILADVADSKSATSSADISALNYAYGRIDSLTRKYGRHFLFLERRRSYSKGEDTFMGWERKRGAVCELVNLLRDKENTFSAKSCAMAQELFRDLSIKYVITLDADTNLPPDTVVELCSCMLHPLCRPTIDKDKGIVLDGYGIMQPRCECELSSSSKTPFSRLFCGAGGTELYSCATYDSYQNIFGEGIFCGKGIFDVDAFMYVINEKCTFPEDTILSHDCLEGAKLRAALLSDIVLTDSFPKNQLSYLKRRHRWVRGDIQNLLFLFDRIYFDGKDVRKNNINFLSKFKLFCNAVSDTAPIFAFICVFLSAFSKASAGAALLFGGLSYIYTPLLLDVISVFVSPAFRSLSRRFFSKGVSVSLWHSLLRTLYTVSMLAQTSLSSIDAALRSLYRMFISQKNLLEWQTFAQSDKGDGSLLMFVNKNIFSPFAAVLLFVFAPVGVLRLISLMWLAFPVISYHSSRDILHENVEETAKMKKQAEGYAKDIWHYFADTVKDEENHLPPDNLQLYPVKKLARRTSPTNIGLYLLSVLCARDFGIIDTEEMHRRLDATISTLERMKKWRGHLYNWYSTETLEPIFPFYISSVDSGNFSACIITLARGLREYVAEETGLLEIISRLEMLEKCADYKILYNEKSELFSLGAHIFTDESFRIDKNCYDLYMSEARTLSFIQCARRNVPKKHWSSLSRRLVGYGGYMGVASWSGTAFEYFMPALFLPVKKRSLAYEALCFTLSAQKKYCATLSGEALWGISESGFYSFDDEENYGYYAFGVPYVALRNESVGQLVISPYSSFLSMCVGKRAAFSNLKRLKKHGFYGEYGFYEAIDFTPERLSGSSYRIVKSFMAHHLGMSLCALCNCAFDNILCRRFMSDPHMMSAAELLEEKIPVNAPVRSLPRRHSYIAKDISALLANEINKK